MEQAIRVIMWSDTDALLPRIELHEEFATASLARLGAQYMHKKVPQYTNAAVVGDFGQDLYKFESRVVVNIEWISD